MFPDKVVLGAMLPFQLVAVQSGIVVSLIVAAFPTFAVVVGFFLNRQHLGKQDDKIQAVHVLVDGRLNATLEKMEDLEKEVRSLKRQRGNLRKEVNEQ